MPNALLSASHYSVESHLDWYGDSTILVQTYQIVQDLCRVCPAIARQNLTTLGGTGCDFLCDNAQAQLLEQMLRAYYEDLLRLMESALAMGERSSRRSMTAVPG